MKLSRYPEYIRSLEKIGEFLDEEPKGTVTLCVQGLGRSPEMAYQLTETGHPAYALMGGLSGIVESRSLRESAQVLSGALAVIATVNDDEVFRFRSILNGINRLRTREVIIAENFFEILSELRK